MVSRLDALEAAFIEQAKRRAEAIIRAWAREVTAWMKQNAPWRDRTTNARQSLGWEEKLVEWGSDLWLIVLTGGVPYQKFLERNFAGRYRILGPALEQWGGVLVERLGAEQE